MPAIKKISKEAIIDAAVDVLREGGAAAINARSVAKKLGCSTQPIYLSFQNMDDLKAAMTQRAIALHTRHVRNSNSDTQYSCYGMGFVKFAAEERHLFRWLYLDKDHFVITTNVDQCFQKAGFDKKRLFYTQGDYGLFQCSEPCCQETFGNEAAVRGMLRAQGFAIDASGALTAPESGAAMEVPAALLPMCPHCGKPMTLNLRCDDSFVEDEGWHRAAERYDAFLRARAGQKLLFLELGVGYNTPVIIKYPFWRMTAANPKAVYACLNMGEAGAPREIQKQSICIDGDIGEVLFQL